MGNWTEYDRLLNECELARVECENADKLVDEAHEKWLKAYEKLENELKRLLKD